ncbi:uncharacterized protein LOC111031155 isoform X1 [Myzus persicae]|uniref:uncharacterized protein LOC111031155 isoform X1 n=1 Tax=Myzus persicae TaxID=13164 RepID=UPI000B9319A9|nr:uncharacterized protein LOC111031155 isoform X1 [Myzus persicae]
MYSNAKHVAPSAVLILILCVLSTDQTLFSRKKSSTPISPSVDNVAQQSKPVPQKETSHWWQMKFKASESNENSVSNQVAVPVPVPVRQKLQSIFETHFNSDVKWVPCLCPVRKGGNVQQHHQQQPQSQPQQHQQQQKYGASYYSSSTTQAPSDLSNNDVPRFIFANYPIEA